MNKLSLVLTIMIIILICCYESTVFSLMRMKNAFTFLLPFSVTAVMIRGEDSVISWVCTFGSGGLYGYYSLQ